MSFNNHKIEFQIQGRDENLKPFAKYLLMVSIITYLLAGCSLTEKKTMLSSDNLKQTNVTPQLEEKIDLNKNLLYSSTFQLAWNELKDEIIKGNIVLDTPLSMVDSLNKSLSTKNDVSQDAVVAMAGYEKDGIQSKINKALKEKFKGQAPTVEEKLGPEDILAYGFLYKNLEFVHEFECLEEPINFKTGGTVSKVKGFGIKKYTESEQCMNLGKQVTVFDYKNDSDFIICLESKSKDDDFILAKVEPKQTLLETVKMVEDRIKNGKQEKLEKGDTVQIPSIDFDIRHSCNELEGKGLKNQGFDEYVISKAIQDTRFKLDEKGAVLKSEAKIVVVKGEMKMRKEMKLVFDKPFIVMIKDRNSKLPYFALWVGNTELLNLH